MIARSDPGVQHRAPVPGIGEVEQSVASSAVALPDE